MYYVVKRSKRPLLEEVAWSRLPCPSRYSLRFFIPVAQKIFYHFYSPFLSPSLPHPLFHFPLKNVFPSLPFCVILLFAHLCLPLSPLSSFCPISDPLPHFLVLLYPLKLAIHSETDSIRKLNCLAKSLGKIQRATWALLLLPTWPAAVDHEPTLLFVAERWTVRHS